MVTTGKQSKKSQKTQNQNTIETLKNLGGHMAKNTASEFKKIGTGIFDQFFGNSNSSEYPSDKEEFGFPGQETKVKSQTRKEFSLFNFQDHYEHEIVKRDIKNLSEQIKKEIEMIKKAESSLLNEVKDIQKMTLESLPEKPGIYHVRFFELILSILRTVRAKIGESRTWMQAMITKRKKRGSLFASLSKKKGTKYSLSQEIQ